MRALNNESGQDSDWRSVEAIENALHDKKFWLTFPPALEAQFEHDTMPARRKALSLHVALATVPFNLFMIFDPMVFPDARTEVIIVRGILYTLVCLATGYGVYISSSARMREIFLLLGGYWTAGTVAVLATLGLSSVRVEFLYGMIPVFMFGVLVLRIRFPYAVALAAGVLAIHSVALYSLPEPATLPGYTSGLMLVMAVFTVMAGYAVEREYRKNYLGTLRERMRSLSFEKLAGIDPLTGVANRRGLEIRIEELKRSDAVDQVAVIFADIDHFKAYNDGFGHVAGDACLRRMASLLALEMRGQGDRLYRYGGEEFVAVLAGLSEDGALLVAERMRRAVMRANIPHCWPTNRAKVTVSLGVASARLHDSLDYETLFKQADTALYYAKMDGRNRARTATQHFAASGGGDAGNSAAAS